MDDLWFNHILLSIKKLLNLWNLNEAFSLCMRDFLFQFYVNRSYIKSLSFFIRLEKDIIVEYYIWRKIRLENVQHNVICYVIFGTIEILLK